MGETVLSKECLLTKFRFIRNKCISSEEALVTT